MTNSNQQSVLHDFLAVRKGIAPGARVDARNAAMLALARIEEQLEAERREEWCEGIVNVLDHEGNYLGCMGSETWAWTLDGGIKRMKEQYEVQKRAFDTAQRHVTAQRVRAERAEEQLATAKEEVRRLRRLFGMKVESV